MGLGEPNTLTYAVAALAVLPLALLPGLPAALAVGRRLCWPLPTILAASFALQVGVVGLVALAAHHLGLSLDAAAAASAVVLVGGGLAALVRERRDLRVDAQPAALAFAGACALAAAFERTWFARMADAFYHMAAVRSLLATQHPLVTDPLFGSDTRALDATAGAFHTVLAVWSRATALDVAAWLWPGTAVAGSAITALAFWGLAHAASRSPRAATLATAGWVALSLGGDFRWAGYPNRLSLALAFTALTAIVSLAERPAAAAALVAVVAGFATVATHLAAGEMLAAALAAVLVALAATAGAELARRRACEWRPLALTAGSGAVTAALAAPVLLPKAVVVRSSWLVDFHAASLAAGVLRLPGGLLVDTPGHLMRTSPVLFLAGAVVAVAAGVVALRSGERRAAVVAALAGLPLALFLDPPVTTPLLGRSYYLAARVALLLPFTVFVGLAWAARAVPAARRRVVLPVLAAAVLAAGGAWLAFGDGSTGLAPGPDSVWRTRHEDVRLLWGADTLRALRTEFAARYPRVAADTETSYYLAALEPVSVVAVTSQHTPFAVEATYGQRARDAMNALTQAGTPEEERRRIVRDWDAEYVLVPKYRGDLAAALGEMRGERGLLTPVVETSSVVLFRVAPSARR